MDDVYEKLRQCGHNTVENLVKWMQESEVLERAKESEDKATALFNQVKDQTNVSLVEFEEVVMKTAAEKKRTLEEVSEKLAQVGPCVLEALNAAAKAASEYWNKKE